MNTKPKNTITYIDLFAGAGGLSEGFTANGYIPIAHVEMNEEACYSLKTRACYYYLKQSGKVEKYYAYLKGDLSRDYLYALVPDYVLKTVIHTTMSSDNMPNIFTQVDNSMKEHQIDKIDLIIGGPPCQAYSLVGRAVKGESIKKDPRNYLYKLYCDVLEKYSPEMFVFENVPGLMNANNGTYFESMKEEFRRRGYNIDHKVLNAADFGVLQNRKRVIIIGWKGKNHSYPIFEATSHNCTVNDILSDLPSLQPGEEKKNYKTENYSEFLKLTGIRKPDSILTWHVARNHIDRDREIYRIAIKTWEYSNKRLKYTDLPEELCTHKNRTAFLDRYKVVAANIGTCHTMMAHISKDGHYFIHPDIKQARSISVREAARIQSFPDDFFFEGSRTSAFTQIGNAVPPLMANGIAKALKKEF